MTTGHSAVVALLAHPAILAHEGGWDEALLIAGPIVAIAALLVLAKRRVDAAARDRSEPD